MQYVWEAGGKLSRTWWSNSSLDLCLWVACQMFIYQTLALLVFLWIVFLAFEVPGSYPLLLSTGGHISLSCLTAVGLIFLWGPCTYLTGFATSVHLSYVNFIIVSAKEPRRGEAKIFLPSSCLVGRTLCWLDTACSGAAASETLGLLTKLVGVGQAFQNG